MQRRARTYYYYSPYLAPFFSDAAPREYLRADFADFMPKDSDFRALLKRAAPEARRRAGSFLEARAN